jgi:hypothetical protein
VRWVFYALLIFNLAYAAWRISFLLLQSSAPAPVVAEQAAPLNAPVTLTVITGDQSSATLPPAATTSEATAPVVTRRLCNALGPWQDEPSADNAKADLDGIAANASVRAVPVQKQGLTWVYLPPLATHKAALDELRKLQRLAVDSFIVSDGEDANAISLGYFSSRDSALGLQQRMEQAGFAAQVRMTSHDITEYWLFLGQTEASVLQPYLDQHPDLILAKESCSASQGMDGSSTAVSSAAQSSLQSTSASAPVSQASSQSPRQPPAEPSPAQSPSARATKTK